MSSRKEIIKEIIKEFRELLYRLSEKEVIVPTADDLVEINREVTELGGNVFGVRDVNLVKSCVDAVYNAMEYEGETDVLKLSLILFERIIRNHPFVDGNKRTAVVACEMMLRLNGIDTQPISRDMYYRLAYAVAQNVVGSADELYFMVKGKQRRPAP